MPIFTTPADPVAMEALALKAFGPINHALSTRDELRFGTNGSKSVKPKSGVFFDHETGKGGGFRDLYKVANGSYPENGTDKSGFLIPPKMLADLGNPVAWWDYHDGQGEVVARVVRFHPPGVDKTFRQCRPDGARWVWKMDGLQIPLYRLPELLRAPTGSTIYLPEGEKHVDRLREGGLLGTTMAGGTFKFRADHARSLVGHNIMILSDHDEVGHEHGQRVMEELRRSGVAGYHLPLPGLPPKGDVLDWLAAGGTIAQLKGFAEALLRQERHEPKPVGRYPIQTLTPTQIGEEQHKPYVVKGLIARGDHIIAMGQPGSGKSVIAPYVAYAVAKGMYVLGRRVKAGPVLYLASEDGNGMKGRVRALLRRYGDAPNFHLVPITLDLMADGLEREAIDELVRRIKPVLIVIDTLAKSFPGLRENESEDMGRVIRVARDLTTICGSAVWSIHHVAKESGSNTPRGHGSLGADADLTIFIGGAKTETRNVSLGKNKNGPDDATFAFDIEIEVLGMDEDGDPITAPIAVEVAAEKRGDIKQRAKEAKLNDGPALILRALRNADPVLSKQVEPEPGMGVVTAIRRADLRAKLIDQGWFPEHDVLSDALNSPKLTRPGLTRESNGLNSLTKSNIINFNREWVWLIG